MGQPRFRPVKRCVFCGNKADSHEHAWSDWAIKRFRGPRDQIVGQIGDDRYFDPYQKSLRVRCVCIGCNTGWMKGLEDGVIPSMGLSMQDVSIPLDVSQQGAIARWAVLKAIVFEYVTNVDHSIFYLDAERTALRTNGTLPANTAIWLARYDGIETFYSKATRFEADEGPLTADGYVTTMAYRRLVIQVLTIRIDQPEESYARLFRKPGPWQHTILQIWPTGGSIEWPPRLSIGTGEPAFIDFHQSFAGVQQTAPGPEPH